MERPYILHMLSPQKHVSPFDVNMALDAGFNTVVPYINVEMGDVVRLVQDAIFSRGPKGVKRTGVFIGGKDAGLALDMLEAARKSMFPPFQMSVFADPNGSFTTAAAMIACMESKLKGSGWQGLRTVVFGATGVVGYSAAVIAGLEGAKVTLIGYDGTARVKKASEDAKKRFDVDLAFADGSTEDLKGKLVADAEIVVCAGRAGVQVLSKQQIAGAKDLKVVADVNAVPPAGIEGLDAQADGTPIEGTKGVGISALAIGGVKYRVESDLFKKMIESDEALYLDFRDAFALARGIVG